MLLTQEQREEINKIKGDILTEIDFPVTFIPAKYKTNSETGEKEEIQKEKEIVDMQIKLSYGEMETTHNYSEQSQKSYNKKFLEDYSKKCFAQEILKGRLKQEEENVQKN